MKYYLNDLEHEIPFYKAEMLKLFAINDKDEYRIYRRWEQNEFHAIYIAKCNEFIRLKYTLDDELMIQRERDEKPEQFSTYNNDVKDALEKTQRYTIWFRWKHLDNTLTDEEIEIAEEVEEEMNPRPEITEEK